MAPDNANIPVQLPQDLRDEMRQFCAHVRLLRYGNRGADYAARRSAIAKMGILVWETLYKHLGYDIPVIQDVPGFPWVPRTAPAPDHPAAGAVKPLPKNHQNSHPDNAEASAENHPQNIHPDNPKESVGGHS